MGLIAHRETYLSLSCYYYYYYSVSMCTVAVSTDSVLQRNFQSSFNSVDYFQVFTNTIIRSRVKVMHAISLLLDFPAFHACGMNMFAPVTFLPFIVVVSFFLISGCAMLYFFLNMSGILNHLIPFTALTTIRTFCCLNSSFSSIVSKFIKCEKEINKSYTISMEVNVNHRFIK